MRVVWLAVLAIAFCTRLPAPLVPGANLAERIQKADSIVVAKLNSATTRASGSQVASDITLHVDRVLKGGVIPGTDLAAHLEGRGYFASPTPEQLTTNEKLYGIWFLASSDGRYTVVSRDGKYGELYSAPVLLPEGAPAGKTGETPAASVANELASALRFVTDKRRLLEAFQTLDASTTLPLDREFAADPSAALRVVGIQGLIAANDPEGMKLAAAQWSELAATAEVNPIINALMAYSNASDAEAVRALGALALRDRPEPGLRENAVYALRAIHTKDALPPLMALLDDSAERVRPVALSGLCLYVRNAPVVTPESIPSMSWMQSRPPAPLLNPETEHWCLLGGTKGTAGELDAYVSFWKTWWIGR
jgi:hypothetical protein